MNNIKDNLGSDSILSIITTVSNAFYPWIVLITLSKYVGMEIVGIYAFAAAIFMPIFKASALSLKEITATNYTINSVIITSFKIRLWTSLIAYVISILFIITGVSDRYWPLILVLGIIRIVESLFDYSSGLYLREDNYKYMAISAFTRNVIFPLLMTCIIYLLQSPEIGFVCLMVCQLGFYITFEFKIIKQYSYVQDRKLYATNEWFTVPTKREFLPYLKLSFPITSAIFIASVNASTPRIIGTAIFDAATVGLLAGFVQISNAFVPLLSGFTHALMPKLGRSYQTGSLQKFKKYVLLLFGISSACSLSLYIVSISEYSEKFLEILLNDVFAENIDYFKLIAISTAFSYFNCVMGPVKISQLQYKNELVQNSIVFILLVILCLVLGNIYGLVGIFYSIILSQAFRSIWLLVSINIGIVNKFDTIR
ncbi:MAG: hypothetical protein ABW076_06330 [Candidatus Thiodiazotropha sp.]